MASASSMPVRIGRWNNDPTDARTVFGFHGSTEPEVRITPSAPKASAQRITVPAFPGSRTCAQITSSWASATSLQPKLSCRQTATIPCGVTVSESCRIAASVPCQTGTSKPSRRSAWRSGSTTITPVTTPSAASASRTACLPSARNSPARPRPRRWVSRRMERSTELGSSRAAFGVWTIQAAAGVWFARETATSAAKASVSVTARSARILRSTSTPAFFRPLMKRL